jgi:TrmH family RNA methyltransferase
MIITSKQNPTVKALGNLRRRREREREGITIVGGFEELSCAIDSGVQLDHLYYCPELMGGAAHQTHLQELLASGVRATEFTRDVFEKVAYR